MNEIVDKIDYILMRHICMDLINGTLYTGSDDHELEMILGCMYDDMSSYERMGVTIGKA